MATATAERTSSGLAMRAHMLAVQQLISENQERYDEIKRNQRVAFGLTPVRVKNGKTAAEIRQRIENAQKKIEALQTELAKLNGDG